MDESRLAHVPTTTLLKRVIGAKLKELFYPRYLQGMGSLFLGPARTDYNYAAEVANYAGLTSSVVMPVVQWMMRSFPEAPVTLERQVGDDYETVHEHPMTTLLAQPNPFYSGAQLWMTTCLDWCLWGESYWRIMAARGGRPAELWWLPPWSIQPQWPADGSVFISHYQYGAESTSQIELPVEEVLHFRHGLDPYNMRHGLPPLRGVFQDIWVDMESAHFVAAMLRNMGIPGIIISPKDAESGLSPEEVERVQAYIQSRFSGDYRGRPMALGTPTDVQQLSLAPNDLALTEVRNTAEERVCSALGIPSAVVGFGTGLESTKVGATMAEMRRLAWQSGLVPVQRIMALELDRTLLPWYETDTTRFRTAWDYHQVEALQESENEKVDRLVKLVGGAILKRSEARESLGYESDKTDEVYHLPTSVEEIQDGEPLREPEPLPAPVAGGNEPPRGVANGNGNGSANGNGRAVAVQQRAAALKQGTLEEWVTGLIGRHAQRLDQPPTALKRLATRLMRAEQKLQPQFQRMIGEVLSRYGAMAATATREIFPRKASVEDVIRTAIVTERMPIAVIKAELAEVYAAIGAQMVALMTEMYKETLNLELTGDARLRTMVEQAATERVRLLDLETEARAAVLDILDHATTEGLSEDVVVEMIQEKVPAGRWSSSLVRSQIIARSESRYLGNVAASAFAEQSGMGRVLILDALLGPTDAICHTVNGWIVTPTEGRTLAASEHPQGTRMVLAIPAAQLGAVAT